MRICLILHNIRSIHNVGSIFRTADAMGVKKIFLTGYTPSPLDFFGQPRKDFQKTALGSDKSVEWIQNKNINKPIVQLKKGGYRIIALEQSKKSINLKKFRANKSSVLILGNEVRGLPKNIINKSDVVLEIQMLGRKESLNVSVAAGIALFVLRHKF
jgi:23S rRNA (guanosine2251-2'-O)-methyltransferase